MPETAFDDHGSLVRWHDLPGRLPARVFVHGLGGVGSTVFGGIVSQPDLDGHRSLVLDLPGHGLSDRPAGWSYSLDAHAGAVVRVCEAAGLERIDLVGHSLGGDIAVVVASRHPDLVARLVISEANLDPLPASSTADRASQRISAMSEDEFVERGYRHLIESNPSWAPTLELCDPRAVYRSAVGLTSGTQPTMREMVLAMSIPRTFIRGDRGETLGDPEGLAAAGVRVVTIPDAGHMMMHDNPTAFVAALAEAFAAGS